MKGEMTMTMRMSSVINLSTYEYMSVTHEMLTHCSFSVASKCWHLCNHNESWIRI